MIPTAIISHPDCALHDTGSYHPERAERTQVVVDALQRFFTGNELLWLEAEPAALKWIETVHDAAYVRQVEEVCLRGESVLDRGDTQVCEDSFAVARLAVGAGLMAVDVVMQGRAKNAFSVMRPPGHHAERAEAMGFCLFNNIAIAARYAQQRYGLSRVAIIDIDVHHGNGTQSAFYRDPTVFFVSFHQYPFYPGTGMKREIGDGPGEGFTLNIPLVAGASYAEYLSDWQTQVLPALQRFSPELILLSTGFDAHVDDPLANLNLNDADYHELTRLINDFALQSCDGRLVSIMEGGYSLDALARASICHVRALCNGK
ncbi:acetoin utilization protein [Cerasicoccus arenae]|uniref:Acetoin utilization protein n=2 Tax=Cerasicoccus arenae TaxID=424488 RepID=A0A8J3DFU8_9BACT|nr:histone deacetylase [Cerasicoccus arenae]GHB96555.1 acetoin utilization protein [Cerasicoccus arenae]